MEEEVKKILCENGLKITNTKRGSFNDINYTEITTSDIVESNFFVCGNRVVCGFGKEFKEIYNNLDQNPWLELWQFDYYMSMD